MTPIAHDDGGTVRCPALNPETHQCTIYAVRPLDCSIYPFLLMWDDQRQMISLTLHEACPFVFSETPDSSDALFKRAHLIAKEIEAPEMLQSLSNHPGLMMSKQPDTRAMIPLYHLTEAILPKESEIALSLPKEIAIYQESRNNRLIVSDLVHSAFLPHLIWSDLLEYRWASFSGMFCLFATAHGMTHLALPPFGAGSLLDATALAFARMAHLNLPSVLSRIDNVDEQAALLLEKAGYLITPSSPDYLYQREEIIHLTGNKFRAQRACVNQANRVNPILRRFTLADTADCLLLYDRWAACSKDDGELDTMMKEDAKSAHQRVMAQGMAHGAVGYVVEVSGVIAGYTFGFPLSSDTFCVLLEVADHSIRGLSAWLFQSFCRELESYTFINTMDDSGLTRLAIAKAAWHPIRQISSYTVALKTPLPCEA